jgi:acyl-CoA dehydrogenase
MSALSAVRGLVREHLDWPFFGPEHRDYAARLDRFAASEALSKVDHHDVDGSCRTLAAALGEAGLLDACVAAADGDASTIDSRKACLARETLAFHDGLADFAFAMQGLGSGAIGLAGSPELRRAFLPKARSGEWLAAFALSEKPARTSPP